MKNYLSAFVCLLLSFHSALAQENWDAYTTKFGDKRGSVMLDMNAIERAPDKNYPYLVITGPRAKNCDKDGFPANDEIDKLEEVLDGANNFLTGVTAKVLVATFTYNCERLNYYYVKDTMNARNALQRMYKRNFGDYDFAINMKYEPDWSTYRNFLYPDDTTITWMENARIIVKLRNQGIDDSKETTITFLTYFKTEADRKNMADYALGKDFKIDMFKMKEGNNPYILKLSKAIFIKATVVNPIAVDIIAQVRKYNGVYDAWDAINAK